MQLMSAANEPACTTGTGQSAGRAGACDLTSTGEREDVGAEQQCDAHAADTVRPQRDCGEHAYEADHHHDRVGSVAEPPERRHQRTARTRYWLVISSVRWMCWTMTSSISPTWS